jgi:hypothetical protein
MTVPKTTNLISVADAAYIAGIIDGEGTVTLTRKHKNENRQLAITISSCERYMLEFVQQSVGVGKITNKRVSQAHHSPSFTYSVYNRQALSLLKQIHPYLRSYKVKRSALALRDYVDLTPRNGKYSEQKKLARDRFEIEFLDIKPVSTIAG